MTEPTRAQMQAICNAAGVTKDEIIDHPQFGLAISLSGAVKLAKLAPNGLKSGRLMDELLKVAADLEARGDGE